MTLDDAARRVVADTIAAHCEHRGWELVAMNVRSNHVHVAVTNSGVRPERVMGELKAWATRRLREAGRVGATASVWTHHGSTRYLWDAESVKRAVEYVAEGQGPDIEQ